MSSWKTMFGHIGENMYETDDKCNLHWHIRRDELCHEHLTTITKTEAWVLWRVPLHCGEWSSITYSESWLRLSKKLKSPSVMRLLWRSTWEVKRHGNGTAIEAPIGSHCASDSSTYFLLVKYVCQSIFGQCDACSLNTHGEKQHDCEMN